MPPGGIASTVSDIANRILARADRTVSSSSVTGQGQESYRDYYTVNRVVPHSRSACPGPGPSIETRISRSAKIENEWRNQVGAGLSASLPGSIRIPGYSSAGRFFRGGYCACFALFFPLMASTGMMFGPQIPACPRTLSGVSTSRETDTFGSQHSTALPASMEFGSRSSIKATLRESVQTGLEVCMERRTATSG